MKDGGKVLLMQELVVYFLQHMLRYGKIYMAYLYLFLISMQDC